MRDGCSLLVSERFAGRETNGVNKHRIAEKTVGTRELEIDPVPNHCPQFLIPSELRYEQKERGKNEEGSQI